METPSRRGTISTSQHGRSTFIFNVTLRDLGVESVASSKVYADLSLSMYLCIFVSTYLSVYLSIHLSIHLHISEYLSVCIAGNIFCLQKTKHLRVIELFCAGGCLDCSVNFLLRNRSSWEFLEVSSWEMIHKPTKPH
jgi:hypothetical protein